MGWYVIFFFTSFLLPQHQCFVWKNGFNWVKWCSVVSILKFAHLAKGACWRFPDVSYWPFLMTGCARTLLLSLTPFKCQFQSIASSSRGLQSSRDPFQGSELDLVFISFIAQSTHVYSILCNRVKCFPKKKDIKTHCCSSGGLMMATLRWCVLTEYH